MKRRLSMSITLHKTLGLNTRMTFCPRCHGEAHELIMLGNKNNKGICSKCGLTVYGSDSRHCPECNGIVEHVPLEQSERLPATDICDDCKKEVTLYEDIVAEGGVYWKCSKCHCSGVIKSNEFTADVRKAHGLTNGEPCGVDFNGADDCPCCGGENGES
jgi:hypothetical protein